MNVDVTNSSWAEAWQGSWDRQQEGYMPDREQRLRTLLDVVETVAGTEPLVLDLACGTGTITRRLLERFPAGRSIMVDVDPALLAIASATFAGDDRVRIVHTDLRNPFWIDDLPERPVDAVVTATALHWFQEGDLRRLYRDLYEVVRPGGAVANADEMPLEEMPRLGAGLRDIARQRQDAVRADGRPDWDRWWDEVAEDPVLAVPSAVRMDLFGGKHAPEFVPAASWHVAALTYAGFAEVGVPWRSGPGAVVAAVR